MRIELPAQALQQSLEELSKQTSLQVMADPALLAGKTAPAVSSTLAPRDALQLKLFTRYRLPGDWNGLTLGGGVNWENSNYTMSYNPAGNLERLEQSSFALVSLMARYEFNPAVSLQLNIENLFDEKFYSQIGFYDQLAFGPPRNFSLLLNYRFR